MQISSALKMHDWQAKNDAARKEDQRQLVARLDGLKHNVHVMDELRAYSSAFLVKRNPKRHTEINQENITAMMVSLMRQMEISARNGPEFNFYSRTLLQLSAISGRQVEVKDWMVTAYDVEFVEKIGFGGL